MSSFKKGRRRFGGVGLSLGLVVALMVAFAPHAIAIHDLDFQLEGNTAVDSGPAQPYDWETFFDDSGSNGTIGSTGTLPGGFTAAGFASSGDPAAPGDFYLPDQTVFATGSKDTLNISTGWQCKKANNVGDKVDIVNAYSAVYTDANGDTILYFGIEKSSPNGDSNVAVWFLQDSAVGCDSTGGGNVSFSGDHEDGDLLLVSAFTNGGTQANVAAYKWEGGANGSLNPTPVATGALCGDPDDPDPAEQDACAITNDSPIDPPWAHPDKDSKTNPDLNPLEFFEGGVNLTDAGILDACFARFLANTRSSQSLTATIFDFATGNLQTCAPSTDLTVSANKSTVHSGESVTVTIKEKNDGINPLSSPSVTVDPADCTPTYASGDTDTNGILDVDEEWTFTCALTPTSTTTYTFTGHGLDPRGLDVSWDETDCDGVDDGEISDSGDLVCDSDEVGSVAITVINPSTDLTADVVATFTFYEENDGDAALSNPSVTATGCDTGTLGEKFKSSSTTINVGDTGEDDVFGPGETWVWTCTVTRTSSGTSNVDGIGSGVDTASTPKTITFCADVGSPPTGTQCDQDEDAGGSVTLNANAD